MRKWLRSLSTRPVKSVLNIRYYCRIVKEWQFLHKVTKLWLCEFWNLHKNFGTQVHLLFAKRLFFLFCVPLKVSRSGTHPDENTNSPGNLSFKLVLCQRPSHCFRTEYPLETLVSQYRYHCTKLRKKCYFYRVGRIGLETLSGVENRKNKRFAKSKCTWVPKTFCVSFKTRKVTVL